MLSALDKTLATAGILLVLGLPGAASACENWNLGD